MKKTLTRYIVFALLLFVLGTATAMAQDVIRVTCQVVDKNSGRPMPHTVVKDMKSGKIFKANEDGRVVLDVRKDATLQFSLAGTEPVTVKVKGRTSIRVEMVEKAFNLGEAAVVVKREKKKIKQEENPFEIVGNYAHLNTALHIPGEMIATNTRVVIQPYVNNVTRRQVIAMRPVVIDGWEYAKTQTRMYDQDIAGDPLATYIVVRKDSMKKKFENGDREYVVGYKDSVYIDNNKDDLACVTYMVMENYHKLLYRDTVSYNKGSINPLRFLDYSFSAYEVTDESYFPAPEKQLRADHGEVNLNFEVGKKTLNMNDSRNAAEVENMNRRLQEIISNPEMNLHALKITGIASPEGRYELNKELASGRLQTAMNIFLSRLDNQTREGMKTSTEARVATWNDVINLLRKDNQLDLANQVQNIVNSFKSIDTQGQRIRRLPQYNLIAEKYLPQLRKVNYELEYDVYRQLNYEEIKDLYDKDPKQLTDFEYFKLYRSETDSVKREKYLNDALKNVPSLMVAANDLAVLQIRRGKYNPDILARFAGAKFSGRPVPTEVNLNQMATLLGAGQYAAADTLAPYIPDMPEVKYIKALNGVLNGEYKSNYDYISNTSLQNKVVMLLAMKRNREALENSLLLPNDKAKTHYLRAICYNRSDRTEEVLLAEEELNKALDMDPSLQQIAEIDGDVVSLLKKDKKKVGQTK